MLGGAVFYGDSGASGRGLVRAMGRGSMARTIGAGALDPIGGALSLAASRDMAAERGGAAALDGRHDLELAETQMACLGLTPSRPVGAEDIRDLQRVTRHASAPGSR